MWLVYFLLVFYKIVCNIIVFYLVVVIMLKKLFGRYNVNVVNKLKLRREVESNFKVV